MANHEDGLTTYSHKELQESDIIDIYDRRQYATRTLTIYLGCLPILIDADDGCTSAARVFYFSLEANNNPGLDFRFESPPCSYPIK